jgi:sialate O-acetylesterase
MLIVVFAIVMPLCAQLRLPKLVSDGMILQRDTELTIWGWADQNENITIDFKGKSYHTVVDSSGEWKLMLPEQKAGGPYEMRIRSEKEEITLHDILIGDVWFASGQSNMELPMRRVSPIYENEIKTSECAFIRQFCVPQRYNFKYPEKDLEKGSWISANPQTVLDFSAVAYFFARELYEKYEVPVGIINASLGGSPIQAWMSEEALKEFPSYYSEAQQFKNDELIQEIEKKDNERITEWYNILRKKDRGYQSEQSPWYLPNIDTSDWLTMTIPGYWSDTYPDIQNGSVWFRKRVEIPSHLAGKPAKLILGRIIDADSVYLNGVFVGTTGYQYPPRRYDIPPNLLQKGENEIVVRVISNAGKGGFVPDKLYALIIDNDTIDLTGEWKIKQGAEMPPLPGQTFVRWKPTGLYNAMVAPVIPYRIQGFLWYQGESNTDKPYEYRFLLEKLIGSWRNEWQQGDLPFLFVQLPNYGLPVSEPTESNWAILRESQLVTFKKVPLTGMAVTIDLGEWNDIHPLRKKEVGERLALWAQKIAHGEKNRVCSGPIYDSMEVKGNVIWLKFKEIGSGLIAKRNLPLKEFAIAGSDKKFVWAEAEIMGDRVKVWSEKIAEPAAVRYAWADNPANANLYNKEGLPASPFRTDNW